MKVVGKYAIRLTQSLLSTVPGTFGYVLLGEYRGTQVAVKRVIPPRTGKSESDEKLFQAFDGVDSPATRRRRRNESDEMNTSTSPSFRRRSSAPIVESKPTFCQRLTSLLPWKKAAKKKQWKRAMEFYLRAQSRSVDPKMSKDQWGQALSFYEHDYDKLHTQFVAEMRQLSKLRHPCICTVMGACNPRLSDSGEPMLVMGTLHIFVELPSSPCFSVVSLTPFFHLCAELMARGSLYDLLHYSPVHLNGEMILNMLRDIVQGIRFLHAAR